MHEASDLVLVQLRFKVHRGLVAEGAVEPLPVVKDFDPLEDCRAGLGPRGEALPWPCPDLVDRSWVSASRHGLSS